MVGYPCKYQSTNLDQWSCPKAAVYRVIAHHDDQEGSTRLCCLLHLGLMCKPSNDDVEDVEQFGSITHYEVIRI